MKAALTRWLCLLALWLGPLTPALAHPLDPALLELRETDPGHFEVLWRTPLSQPVNAPLTPLLPARCAMSSPRQPSDNGQQLTQRWQVNCGPASLVGERLILDGLSERKTDALIRVQLADGRLVQAVVRSRQPYLDIPEKTPLLQVVGSYFSLGLEHILTGFDHLLFVLGLLLLVQGLAPLLWTISAFTVGHSVTLSLVVLGWIRVPSAPVEALIALSILIVALEVERDRDAGPSRLLKGGPWRLALIFGFLHGLGFAGALSAAGVPDGEIPLALVSFNIGIEAGQLLFVAAVLALRWLLRARHLHTQPLLRHVPAYFIGSLAAFWLFERLWIMLRA